LRISALPLLFCLCKQRRPTSPKITALKNSLVAYFVSFASFFIHVQATVAKNSKLAVVASGFDLNKNQAH